MREVEIAATYSGGQSGDLLLHGPGWTRWARCRHRL